MSKKHSKINFTKRAIEDLPIPTAKQREFSIFDTQTRGLCIRITPKGVKTFYVRRKVNGKNERLRLGRFPEITVEQARGMAADYHAALARGESIVEEKKALRQDLTLGELFDEYIERHAKKSNKTWRLMIKNFKNYFGDWVGRKLTSITVEDLERRHIYIADARGKNAANRAVELIKALYNKGIKWRLYRGENPAFPITMFPEKKRNRIIQADEFQRFFEALDQDTNERFKDYIKLILLTGARKSEVLSMRWQDIDFKGQTWVIPDSITKNGEAHTVALTEAELTILDRRWQTRENDYVFPGKGSKGHFYDPKKSWARLIKRADIEDLHLHDLRRTMASWMANTGANASLIQSALNHKDIKTTMLVYAHTAKDAERDARRKAHDFMLSHRARVSEF